MNTAQTYSATHSELRECRPDRDGYRRTHYAGHAYRVRVTHHNGFCTFATAEVRENNVGRYRTLGDTQVPYRFVDAALGNVACLIDTHSGRS